tara:strand:+ start:161 stop:487 length:327 start_codon:yes stop_codon:yes gene_type:complete
MNYDHEAIRKAYPNVVIINDDDGVYEQVGTTSDDEPVLEKVDLAQSKIDEARVTLNAEEAARKYRSDREKSFVSIGDQLDMQYWDAVNGTTTWKDHIAKVKSDNPKPS